MKFIFVFGSNTHGIHGAGAAKHAFNFYGAAWGVGEGRFGLSYALPTKYEPYENMPLGEVQVSIVKFMDYAAHHPELKFHITQIGCGRAGYTKEQIAPLFTALPVLPNCYFDEAWKLLMPKVANYWGTL